MGNQQLFALGDISARLGIPTHRVAYYIETRGIAPRAKAGAYRLFDEAAVQRIAEIAAEKASERKKRVANRLAALDDDERQTA